MNEKLQDYGTQTATEEMLEAITNDLLQNKWVSAYNKVMLLRNHLARVRTEGIGK